MVQEVCAGAGNLGQLVIPREKSRVRQGVGSGLPESVDKVLPGL